MKLATLATLFLLLCALDGHAQAGGAMRIASVAYDRVAPGQIVELRVEGLGDLFAYQATLETGGAPEYLPTTERSS